MYAFLPVGTLVFLLLLSVFSKVAWKVMPPKTDDLPPVAMIFI